MCGCAIQFGAHRSIHQQIMIQKVKSIPTQIPAVRSILEKAKKNFPDPYSWQISVWGASVWRKQLRCSCDHWYGKWEKFDISMPSLHQRGRSYIGCISSHSFNERPGTVSNIMSALMCRSTTWRRAMSKPLQ